jgi:hypothetical protein
MVTQHGAEVWARVRFGTYSRFGIGGVPVGMPCIIHPTWQGSGPFFAARAWIPLVPTSIPHPTKGSNYPNIRKVVRGREDNAYFGHSRVFVRKIVMSPEVPTCP